MAELAVSGWVRSRIAAFLKASGGTNVLLLVALGLIALAILVVLVGMVVAGIRPAGTPSGSAGQTGIAAVTASPTPSRSQTSSPSRPPPPVTTPIPTLELTPIPVQPNCEPTDQDAYVYNPTRLVVLAACIRVSGVVEAIRTEADGDLHILLALDPEFVGLLRPANQGVELGDLVVEPVCVRQVTQSDAVATCAADVDPLDAPLPGIGGHVWMEGRYVLDSEHGAWAELHPLYRWGPLGGAAATPAPTSTAGSAGSYGFYAPPGWDGYSDLDCADFQTHAQAQSFFLGTGGSKQYDPYRLDGDHDGLACERLP